MRPDHDLERDDALGRALRQLPLARAPRTLLPRVLAATARLAPRPWYTRAWFTWPRVWQASSVAALAVLVAGAVLVSPYTGAAVDGLAALAGPVSARATALFHGAEVTAVLARVLWDALLGPLALAAFALAALVALGGGLCWNTINRLAGTH